MAPWQHFVPYLCLIHALLTPSLIEKEQIRHQRGVTAEQSAVCLVENRH